MARWHKILTIDKLCQRNHIIVNVCLMFLKDEESVHHLTIHCPFDYRVWIAILDKFVMQWVMPRAFDDLFHQWRFGCKYICGKILWKLVLYATLWKLWMERNDRLFRHKSSSVDGVVRSASEWVRTKKEFKGVDLSDLNISWVDVLRGGWNAKLVSRVLWSNPPWGVLKLNFDESFVHSISRGGIGVLLEIGLAWMFETI